MECCGRKVRIVLSDDGGIFEGFIHSMDKQAGKLSLEKVVDCNSGKKMLGLQHFFDTEIEDIDVLEEYSSAKNDDDEKLVKGRDSRGVMNNKYSPAHLSRLRHLDPSKLTLKNQGETSDPAVPDDKLADNEDRSNDTYTILAHFDNIFTEAICFIRKHQVIGVALEGVSLGRSGKLCCLQIGTPTHVFLFDVLTLGEDCFNKGLRDVLEDENILKVFHDCRMASDILYHKYKVKLVNVFDTQVADVFVYRLRHHNDWPRFVNALAPCLSQHLDLPPEQVYWAVIREHCSKDDEEVWAERPMKKHVVEAAVKDVIYLLELRQVLMEKMLEEFVAGVNIYLSHVRDASMTDSDKYQSMKHLLPVAFQDVRQFMESYRGRNPHMPTLNTEKDQHGFRENCSGIFQPDVYFSHDSLWHAGSARHKVEKNRHAGVPEVSSYRETGSRKTSELEQPSLNSFESQGNTVSENFSSAKVKVNTHEPVNTESTDLIGSQLMRALVYSQEGNSHESDSELDSFLLKPAGTLVAQCGRKKSSQNPASVTNKQTYRQTHELQKETSATGLFRSKAITHGPDDKVLKVKNSDRFLRDYKQFIKNGSVDDSESSDNDIIPGLSIRTPQKAREPEEKTANRTRCSPRYNFVPRGVLSQKEIDLCNSRRRSVGSEKSDGTNAKDDSWEDTLSVNSDKTLSPEKVVKNDRISPRNGISLKSLLANQKEFSKNGFHDVSSASASDSVPVSQRMQSLLDTIMRHQSK